MIIIFSFIRVVIFDIILKSNFINLQRLHNETLEVVWTLIPSGILIFLAFPSIHVLYILEEIVKPLISIKIIGHQWYWSYEYRDIIKVIKFDSFIKQNSLFRFYDVDKSLYLPILTQIRALVLSDDVIHSWTLPNIGVKIDANPGRINMAYLIRFRVGSVYGQCSEICGVNHAFIPIKINFITQNLYKNFIKMI